MRFTLIVLFAGVMCIGCQRDEEIVAYEAPKESAPASQEKLPISWTIPAGWTAVAPGNMQLAAFASRASPGVAVSVAKLPPGQSLDANLVRWQRQIEDSSGVDQAKRKVAALKIAGAPAQRVELSGPSQTILAAMMEQPDATWFFKMQGPREMIERESAEFEEFLQSVRIESSGSATPQAAASSDWRTPPNWEKLAAKPMRVIGFKAGEAEVSVSRFAAGAFGAMPDNVNRWRGMVDLPPLSDAAQMPAAQKLSVGDRAAEVYDFTGESSPAKRVRIVVLPSRDGKSVMFFRLHGPAEAVAQEQGKFDSFVQSAARE